MSRSSSSIKHLLLILCLVTGLLVFGSATAFAESDFSTENYDVQINVQEDNSAYITETIDTNITNPIHGIYRYIPLSQTVRFYDNDGQEIKKVRKNMRVEDISVDRDPYTASKEDGNMIIRIGDENKTITGAHTYSMSYRVRLYDDGVKDYDVFYYNVLPTDWETPIKKGTVTITMPKSFEKKNVNVLAGNKKEEYGKAYYNWKVEGNTITIELLKTLPTDSYVTVGILLDEGYWTNEVSDRKTYLFLYGLAILSGLAMLYTFMKRGRDPKSVKTVEFYPPEDLTSAEVGYIIDGTIDKKDIVSLVIYFANKGYLDIVEVDKKSYKLVRKNDPAPDANDFERTLFYALFSGREEAYLSDIGSNPVFYEQFELTGEQIEAKYSSRGNRLFSRKASLGRVIDMVITLAASGIGAFIISILYGSVLVFAPAAVGLIFLIVAYIMGMNAEDRRYTMRKGGKFATTIISLLFLAASCGVTYAYMFFFVGAKIAAACFIFMNVLGYFSFRYMQCRTKYGAEILGKVLGFKEFVSVSEIAKLEMMIEEDPNYFYDILPYAYAMGQTKRWAKKFEGIAQEPPSWYHGTYRGDYFNTMVFYHSFDNCMKDVTSHISVPAPDAYGDGGSSFGGGGFSGGGGFGGGGGGSW